MTEIPKEIQTPEGQIYVLKRPLYKQPLFWTSLVGGLVSLALAAVLGLLMFLGLIYSEVDSAYDSSYVTQPDHLPGQGVLASNDLEVTVERIYVDDKRSLSDSSRGKAVLVQLTVENTASHSVLFSPYDVMLFDQEGEVYVLDASTFDDQSLASNLSAGKRTQLTLIYVGDDEPDKSYLVSYEDSVWGEEKGSSL